MDLWTSWTCAPVWYCCRCHRKATIARMRRRAIVWTVAAVAVVLPRSGDMVERWYSNGLFPLVQRTMTSLSNLMPLALFDVLLVLFGAGVLATIFSVVKRERRHGLLTAGLAVFARLTTITAVAYL